MMRPASLLVFVVAVLLVQIGGAPAASAAPVVEVRQLANGLTVAVEERPGALTAGAALIVRAGTRDDDSRRLGETALLAWALFNAAPRDLERAGGGLAMVVDRDVTCFLALAPATDTPVVLDVLARTLRQNQFDTRSLNGARLGVILNPQLAIEDEIGSSLWPNHPAGRAGAGTEDTIDAISDTDLRLLQNRYYVARNIALTVVGGVRAHEVFQQAEALFGSLPPGERQPASPATAAPPRSGRRTIEFFAEQAEVIVVYPTPGRDSPDYPALVLLSLLLQGPEGLLFQEIRSGHGLARDVDALNLIYTDVGALGAVALVQPQNVETTLSRIEGVFQRVRGETLTPDRLRRLRDEFAGEMILRRESSVEEAQTLAVAILRGDPVDQAPLLAAVNAVTPEDIRRVAERYLSPDRAVILIGQPSPSQ